MVTREAVVAFIAEASEIQDSEALAAERGWDHVALAGVIKSLEAAGMVTSEPLKREAWKLTEEAEGYRANGSPEAQVFNFLSSRQGAATNGDIDAALGEVAKIGFSLAMKNKWIQVDKATKQVTAATTSITDATQADLVAFPDLPKERLDQLKKRKLVQLVKSTSFHSRRTESFSTDVRKKETAITAEMCSKGTWAAESFKPINLTNVSGIPCQGGHLHPLMKVKQEIRQILLLMGFEEMPTNRWVESSFWNFDSLFQPQQHPARDAHDTFFIESPSRAQNIPRDYLERVKEMHEHGGHGSTGWNYTWSEDEARKTILRTHTTAVSARMLKLFAEDYEKTGVFKPRKCFSIDRVFRNETLDATHLAEFHQVEGFVADRGLGLGHLIGVLKEFFRRQGITNLRFKPAFNPYTEPSMEIFGFHPMLNKWVELGNSGIFRPEMLLPMGLPEDVTVIAWGVSLERPTMINYGIANIRDLFGFKQDIAVTKKNPVCWIKATEVAA
jgi:phenylalanyl-tRNA synthetase alpha chain